MFVRKSYPGLLILSRSVVVAIALLLVSGAAGNRLPGAKNGPALSSDIAYAVGPTAKSTEYKDIDGCKLITKAEVGQVMGEKMKDPDSGPASMAGGSICMFEAPDS